MVTGGSGLVGKGVAAAIKFDEEAKNEEWHFLTSKDGDLRDVDATRALFERIKPTHVIHLAAFVGGLYRNMKYPVEFWNANVRMNDNVMLLCHEYKVEKLFSCLSTCVFPDKITYPITEDQLHNGAPHPSNEAYAYTKRMLEMAGRMYRKQYGCNFCTFIPTNVYGPHDNFNLEDSHVMPGLMHRFYNAKQAGEDLVLWGTGSPLRQFIYSVDLGKLIVWGMRNYNEPDPIIFSVPESAEVSIRQVAEMIAKAMGFEGELKNDTTKSDGQFKKTASNAKLVKLNPDFKFTPIQEGIEAAVKWFIENYDTCRK